MNRKQETESAITLGWWLLRCCSMFSIQNRILLQNSNHHQHWTVFVLIPCFMRAWIFRPGSSFYADHTPSLIYRPPVTAAVAIWIRIPLNILYSHNLTLRKTDFFYVLKVNPVIYSVYFANLPRMPGWWGKSWTGTRKAMIINMRRCGLAGLVLEGHHFVISDTWLMARN